MKAESQRRPVRFLVVGAHAVIPRRVQGFGIEVELRLSLFASGPPRALTKLSKRLAPQQ
jgi:hypothetical protein